ncbi:HsdM family class I SAM-dependent methyltransferase [Abyssibacter profundi]|uniref:HsdM family class I SAM-dependent methyltransferase n=1 Tax=Abyssibacter profundi TaxID=2182787 RepID=UPI001403F0C5|nr:N-6 DNA methylase [Abyssibacter profundi]
MDALSSTNIPKRENQPWQKRSEGFVLRAASFRTDDRLLEERRKLGAFYTPVALSQILSNWVIRSASDTVLEPSFGGCGFLQAARNRLSALGCASPKSQIYGCDIDPVAFDYLAAVLGTPVDLIRFSQSDFLSVSPGAPWPDRFSGILANPPYIPYQALGTNLRKNLSNREWPIAGIGGRASLWAYFIAHAVSFLAPKGRMAWVLPGAFLQADYAKPIRRYLASSFERTSAIVLRERIFLDAGTNEETVVLLADGYGSTEAPAPIQLAEATTLSDLIRMIGKWDGGKRVACQIEEARPASLSLNTRERALLTAIEARQDCITFGDIANVRIGLVTGANKFFVLSIDEVEDAGLDALDCTPILAKFLAAPGVSYTSTDHENLAGSGARCYLVGRPGNERSAPLVAYHETFDKAARVKTSTFRKRKIWWQPNDGRVPDAFFPVMHHFGPRLVLNPDGLTNTNTIHRVYFRENMSQLSRRLVAVSMLTTFAQVSAEMVGRRYGSGVLKHEPREAERIRMLVPAGLTVRSINTAFERIDRLLRAGRRDEATAAADALIMKAPGLPDSATETLSKMLLDIRLRRRPQSRTASR